MTENKKNIDVMNTSVWDFSKMLVEIALKDNSLTTMTDFNLVDGIKVHVQVDIDPDVVNGENDDEEN